MNSITNPSQDSNIGFIAEQMFSVFFSKLKEARVPRRELGIPGHAMLLRVRRVVFIS